MMVRSKKILLEFKKNTGRIIEMLSLL